MANTKILIVEDEILIAKSIENTILKLNYHVTGIVDNIDDLRKSIKKEKPDIIIMDIKLEGKLDGIDIIEILYKDIHIPVIYITALEDDEVIDKAIKTEPIGYLVKPFKESELKTIIKLNIYKTDKSNTFKNKKGFISIGLDYYFDMGNRKLYYKDFPLHLGKNELRFLEILILAKGRVVLFDEIKDKVWEEDMKVITKNSIRVMTSRLRRKIDPKLIVSVPYQGYRLNKTLK